MVKTEMQQNEGEVSSLNSTQMDDSLQGHDKSNTPTEENLEHHDTIRSVPSESPLGSPATLSPGLRESPASTCEGAGAASMVGPNSSHGRLSSCSTVKITEEQLKLNPVKSEVGRVGTKTQLLWPINKFTICVIHPQPRQARQDAPEENPEQATSLQAPAVESQRQDKENKRRANQEIEKKQREERMRSELGEERRKKAESLRFDCYNQLITAS